MTASTQLSSLYSHDVHVTLLIDGIPILFGTRAGLAHPLDTTTNAPSSLTSIDALIYDSVKFGKQELNQEGRMVRPSAMQMSLRLSDVDDSEQWDNYFLMRKDPALTLAAALTETGTSVTPNTTSGLLVGEVLHVHGESMKITAIPGTVTVQRNFCRLTKALRTQAHDIGSEVRKQPRHWMGRWCEVRIWVGTDTQQIWYMQLNGPPERDERTQQWKLGFSDILRVLDRDIAVGFDGADVAVIQNASTGGEPYIQLTAATGQSREFARQANRYGSLLVQVADGRWCMV